MGEAMAVTQMVQQEEVELQILEEEEEEQLREVLEAEVMVVQE